MLQCSYQSFSANDKDITFVVSKQQKAHKMTRMIHSVVFG